MTINKPVAVISIDDGNYEDFRAYELLKKYNLCATFNIVTDWINKERYLTSEQLITMYNDKTMEIAAHGFSHKNDDENITKGIETLENILGAKLKPIGFASPGSGMKNDFIIENEAHLKSLGLSYVRTSMNPYTSEKHLEIINTLKDAPEFVRDNVPQLTFSKSFCVNSAVVLHTTDINDLKALVDLTISKKACTVFMFHRTKKPNENGYEELWNYDYYKFKEFVEYLSASDIEVKTTIDAFAK